METSQHNGNEKERSVNLMLTTLTNDFDDFALPGFFFGPKLKIRHFNRT